MEYSLSEFNHNDGLVVHLDDPFYHDLCDRTFNGYTAHYCEVIAPPPVIYDTPWQFRPQWVKKGNHIKVESNS